MNEPSSLETRAQAREIRGLLTTWAISLRRAKLAEPALPATYLSLARIALVHFDQSFLEKRITRRRDRALRGRAVLEAAYQSHEAYVDHFPVIEGLQDAAYQLAEAVDAHNEWRRAYTHDHRRPLVRYLAGQAAIERAASLFATVTPAYVPRSVASGERMAPETTPAARTA